ncbi:intradiol ring-cleavage dioxygenase [Variovorax sp. Sphag1AA]|uniref:intradiol ring-cleavage dioxygenase n=1 Tax=Variovorax sp. Sphag1AA TaxID=2587027 RepID=UPI0017A8B6CB|nr:intradiol ring-cleavage dioxygenase [Variovorax sp. Sphag1AA]MBB3175857.1 protocatechuate 3,4-dioxygenase beta subunit [Variovorax sp. Sphag1AA]
MIKDTLPSEPTHGHSLAEDFARIEAQMLRRRRALAWLGSSAGAFLVGGCGGGGSSSGAATTAATSAATSTTAATTSASASSTSSSTDTSSSASSTSCVADPQETAGPYPADGTNTSSGSTSDILTASGIVRSDIRSSFISSTNVAEGVKVTLTLTLANTGANCAALAGYAVYLWHCDAVGNYSLYSAPAESYLRGVQVSNSAGQVTFVTIFPGCYSGRWPHMHLEVFKTQAAATSGKNAVLTTQLAMPSAVCSAIYPYVSTYTRSVSNFAAISISTDNVFSDNTSAQIAAMTPTMAGTIADGYTATATIALAG